MRRNLALAFFLGIVAGLLLVASGNFLRPRNDAYAAPGIQYKAVSVDYTRTQSIQDALDKYGRDGWQLVAVEPKSVHFIFKK